VATELERIGSLLVRADELTERVIDRFDDDRIDGVLDLLTWIETDVRPMLDTEVRQIISSVPATQEDVLAARRSAERSAEIVEIGLAQLWTLPGAKIVRWRIKRQVETGSPHGETRADEVVSTDEPRPPSWPPSRAVLWGVIGMAVRTRSARRE